MNYFKYFLLLLSLFIYSCINKIDYLRTDVGQIPVVNCLFQEDSIFKVYVGLSSEIISDLPTSISDAKVYILENNEDTLNLTKVTDFLYKSDSIAKAGINYTLVVETKNYGKITARNTIPLLKSHIDTVVANYYNYYFDLEGTMLSTYNITFSNNETQDNYCELSIITRTANIAEDTTYNFQEPSQIYAFGNFLEAENYNNVSLKYLSFSDLSFKKTNTISVHSFPYYFSSDNVDTIFTNNSDEIIILNLKTTSKEYYLYQKSLLLHTDETDITMNADKLSNMLFIPKKIKLYSNINNGMGIFAGYSLSSQYFIRDFLIAWTSFN